jgi:hypothetical protein
MSISKSLTRTEQESLCSAANSAIWHAHQFANTHARRAAREEDYVATLVTDGIPMLARRWDSILSPKGIALKVSGVFCHGHPQVAFGLPRRQVELADLLVVHQHTAKARTTVRALLVQAKMSNDATHRLPSNDPQLELYSSWPDFEFVTGGLALGVRNINEKGKGSGYALVLAGLSRTNHLGRSVPVGDLSGSGTVGGRTIFCKGLGKSRSCKGRPDRSTKFPKGRLVAHDKRAIGSHR